MRAVTCAALLALSAAPVGCTSAPKKKTGPPASTRADGGAPVPFWAKGNRQPGPANVPGGGGPTVDPVSAPGNDPEISGILAGRLVDSFGRAPAAAFIQVTAVGDAAAVPIDVETVNQGHFYIRGLQPGRTYRLVARATRDGRTIAGEAQARPPETRLLIPLSEDFVTSATPPLPGAPGGLRPRPLTPARPNSTGGAAELGAPAAGGPEFNPVVPPRPEQVAGSDHPVPPTATVPSPTGAPGFPSVAPAGPQSFAPGLNAGSPVVVVAGNRVQQLTLAGADGQPWDFSQRRGRLVLFDFWGTWCGPCLRAIPELIRLQSSYGPQGLEVVGIACERVPAADAARKVNDIRRQVPGINYRLLLGDDPAQGAVPAQFGIREFPTLVLVDGDGAILWRGGADQVPQLEQVLRRRLAY